jgi:hypothetical protein
MVGGSGAVCYSLNSLAIQSWSEEMLPCFGGSEVRMLSKGQFVSLPRHN